MKNTLLALSLSTSMLLLVPITASADIQAESFLQLGSSNMNFGENDSGNHSSNNSDSGIDLEGYQVMGSVALSTTTYFSYQRSATSAGGVDLDIKDIGVGYQSALSPSAALFIQLDKTYYDLDSDYSRLNYSETGYRASIGVRKFLTDSLVVNASYQYLDIGERVSDIFVLGARYSLSNKLSLYADYEREQYFDHVSVGVRLTF